MESNIQRSLKSIPITQSLAPSSQKHASHTKFVDLLLSRKRSLWIVTDLVFAVLGYFSFAWISPYFSSLRLAEVSVGAFTFAFALTIVSIGLGLYERNVRFQIQRYLTSGAVAWALSLVLSLTVIYFALFWQIGRFIWILGSIGGFAFVASYRALLSNFLRNYPYRFCFLGPSNPVIEEIRSSCQRKGQNSQYLDLGSLDEIIERSPSISTTEIVHYLQNSRVTDLVIGEDTRDQSIHMDICWHALRKGIRVVDEVSFYSEIFERVPTAYLTKSWFTMSRLGLRNFSNELTKREFDMVLALLFGIVLLPLMGAIALAIKITSRGPIIFTQTRQGRFFQPFRMLKFRTMYVAHGQSGFTKINDQRVTFIGRLIRPLHLDELPQIWNIFKGHMSFVGPRPEALDFAKRMESQVPVYECRYFVRPGLTGLAQISQGYAMDTVKDTLTKLAYDLYYIKHFSLTLDVVIILRTVFCLVRRAR